jgi:hypothetical protein
MNEKSLAKADFYSSIVLMAFGIAATVLARRMPEIPRDPYSAPGVLPTMLGIIIASLGLVMLIRSIMRTKGKIGVSPASFRDFLNDGATRRMFVTIILCISYVFLLGKLLFPLLTFLFVFAFIFLFEYDRKSPFRPQLKKILMAALVAFCSSVSITLVFQYLFLVRLP